MRKDGRECLHLLVRVSPRRVVQGAFMSARARVTGDQSNLLYVYTKYIFTRATRSTQNVNLSILIRREYINREMIKYFLCQKLFLALKKKKKMVI